MERFLSQCARYIYTREGGHLKDICLVFPNRRAGVFFSAYLRNELTHAVIGPKVTTVNELISGYSGLQPGEKLQLISLLYDIFRKHTRTNESFDDFYFWGEVLLADFDDIDRYRVNARDLFTNIADLKVIEGLFDYLTPEQKEALARFWGSLAVTEKKTNTEKFLAVWEKLYPVYHDFKHDLQAKGLAYGGMILRSVIEMLEAGQLATPFSRYYVIGLNALNRCEKAFFEYLDQQGKAVFLWDYDRFYLDDEKHEAGLFLRENLKLFPPPEDFSLSTRDFERKKKIRLAAVSSNYGQAQEIPRFLEEIQPDYKNEFDNTAIVLADESLLFPSLGAVPEAYGSVNVTMGYPVKHSVVYGFLLLLIRLMKNRRKDRQNRIVVYHRYVTDVLNHQLLAGIEPERTKSFLTKIKEENQITVPLVDIDFSPFHQLIFSPPDNIGDYCSYFLKILGWFYELVKASGSGNDLLPELIYSLYQGLEKLRAVIGSRQDNPERQVSEDIFFRLFQQYLGPLNVSFEGEPLSGMQVMGILETRCLDFRHVIILGLNENKWPRTFTAPSFIPFNIRKGFGLPDIDEQDAMYAYYFYRLIQRSGTVYAAYSTLKEGIRTGEMSRYGFQLMYDSMQDPRLVNLDFSFYNDPVPPIIVEGSAAIQKKLLDRNSVLKPLSPTAINLYLQCSLRFYFRYVMDLPEPEEMKDEIDSPVFGNIFHETIERLYKPFEGTQVRGEDIEKIRKNRPGIEQEILRAMNKHYFKHASASVHSVKPEGKNLLIFENIKTFLNRLLKIDLERVPFEIVSLEKKYHTTLQVHPEGNEVRVVVGGTIDRVDNTGGVYRILDYKTGPVDSLSFSSLEELFLKDQKKPKKEILQALIYTLILKDNLGDHHIYQPAIYSLPKLFGNNFNPEIRHNRGKVNFSELEEDFSEHLQAVVAEIFSEQNTFSQTPHRETCQYCPYAPVCLRY